MRGLHKLTFILLVIGGLNWLSVAAGWGDQVARLGSGTAMVVYWLVGLSAIVEVIGHGKSCRYCKPGGGM